MIKSQLSYRTYIFVVLTIATFLFPIYLFFNRVEAFGDNYNLKFLFVSSLMLFVCFWFVLGIIKRVISIKIVNEKITIKNIFFFEKQIRLKDFDGYETTLETSKSGNYEVLYLMKNKKSLIHISEFHLLNYTELRSAIEKNMNNLGFVPFSLLSDWRRYIYKNYR